MPFYPDHVLDEIRNSIDIVPFISESVALKKRGRNHVACCPFHNEKTPSFNVNSEKQIFMCFGCGVGGDVFKFAMLVEHVTFREAVRLLAERCSIPLPQVERVPRPGLIWKPCVAPWPTRPRRVATKGNPYQSEFNEI